jgi:hypothetical protein
MKIVRLLLLVIAAFVINGARAQKKFPEATAEPDSTIAIDLFDRPGGKVMKTLRQNVSGEDFLLFELQDQNDSMFYVKASYAIRGLIDSGWIRKDRHIGIRARNYQGQPLPMFKGPDESSGVRIYYPGYTSRLYQVTDFSGNWLKVKITFRKKTYSGWLAPEMQCSNVYTSCD